MAVRWTGRGTSICHLDTHMPVKQYMVAREHSKDGQIGAKG